VREREQRRTSVMVKRRSSTFSSQACFSSLGSVPSSMARKISICTCATSSFSSTSVRNWTVSPREEDDECCWDLALPTASERYSTRFCSESGNLQRGRVSGLHETKAKRRCG